MNEEFLNKLPKTNICRINPDIIPKIEELRKDKNNTIEKIGEILKIKPYDIGIAIHAGVLDHQKMHTKYRSYNELTEDEKREIKHLYKNEKWFVKEISKKFWISSATVRRVRSESGIKSNFLVEFSEEQENEIVSLYEKGYGSRGIAIKLNVKYPDSIIRVLKKHNVEFRTQADQNKIIGKRKRVYPEFSDYKTTIRQLTELVVKLFPDEVENSKLLKENKNILKRGDRYSIDHIYSLTDAVKLYEKSCRNEILWNVCHPANLRIITCKENSSKNFKSLYTYKELKHKIWSWDLRFREKFGFDDGFWDTMLAVNPWKPGQTIYNRFEKMFDIKRIWGYTPGDLIKWV